MQIKDIIWLPDIIDKLDWKHHVVPEEVEQVFDGQPMYRRIERGKIRGEDLYAALGQTNTGRYLIIFFIHKMTGELKLWSTYGSTNDSNKSKCPLKYRVKTVKAWLESVPTGL